MESTPEMDPLAWTPWRVPPRGDHMDRNTCVGPLWGCMYGSLCIGYSGGDLLMGTRGLDPRRRLPGWNSTLGNPSIGFMEGIP